MALQLNALQRQLEAIYEVRAGYDVEDFVITDPILAQRLDTSPEARETDEKLLVAQSEDGLDLALYLDADLVARLSRDNPADGLHDGNLADFCTALEGVSHFLYLTWNVSLGRSISCLELEMQAEVDKYITVASVLSRQQSGRIPPRLHRWLFEDASFDDTLAAAELQRYQDANWYAGKYCLQLENQYLRPSDRRLSGIRIFSELRRFYRLSLQGKIQRIDTMN